MLASSDYEGTVTLWDAFASAKVRVFQVGFNGVLTSISSAAQLVAAHSPKSAVNE